MDEFFTQLTELKSAAYTYSNKIKTIIESTTLDNVTIPGPVTSEVVPVGNFIARTFKKISSNVNGLFNRLKYNSRTSYSLSFDTLRDNQKEAISVKIRNLIYSLQWQTSSPSNSNAIGFADVIAVGNYLYLVPMYKTADDECFLIKYDINEDKATYIDLMNQNVNAHNYAAGCTDGRYVYLVNWYNSGTNVPLVIIDSLTNSVSSIDFVAGLNNTNKGKPVYVDGYVYIPSTTGELCIYDVRNRTFEFIDLSQGSTTGYSSCTYDGKGNIYMAPAFYTDNTYTGKAMKYNIASKSTTVIDFTVLDTDARGYSDAVFDGKYIWFIPYYNGSSYISLCIKLNTLNDNIEIVDTKGTVGTKSGNSNGKGYNGGCFDGRYIYMSPSYADTYCENTKMAIIDTETGILSHVDVSQNNILTRGFMRPLFHKGFVYLAPNYDGNTPHGNMAIITSLNKNKFLQ